MKHVDRAPELEPLTDVNSSDLITVYRRIRQIWEPHKATVGDVNNAFTLTPSTFGAKGNGINDDSQALIDFFAYLGENGGVGHIPTGTYLVTRQITVPANTFPFRVTGDGKSLSLISVDAMSAFGSIVFETPVGVTLEDWSVDVRNTSRPASILNHGIVFKNPNNCYAYRMGIYNHGGTAILAYTDIAGTFRDVVFTDCYCDGNEANNGNIAGNGFLIEGCEDSGLTECHAYNCEGSAGVSPGIGLQLKNYGVGCWISGGSSDNCLTGVAFGFDGEDGITVGQQVAIATGFVTRNCATGLGLYAIKGVLASDFVIDMEEKVGGGAAIRFFNGANGNVVKNAIIKNTIYYQGAVRFGPSSFTATIPACFNNYVDISLHVASSGTATVPTAAIYDTGANNNTVIIRNASYNVPVTSITGAVTDSSGVTSNKTQINDLLLRLDGPAGTNRELSWYTNNVLRFIQRATTTAEAGSNAGSDMVLLARADDGSALGQVWGITRSTQIMNFNQIPTVTNVRVVTRPWGNTASRPTGLNNTTDRGTRDYFDSTLGYVITWNGTAWVNGVGTVV